MKQLSLICLVSIAAMIFSGGLLANPPMPDGKTFYKWTDTAGRVHFSDRAPSGQLGHVEAQPLQPLPAAVAPAQKAGDDYYSVVNQARRFEKNRRTRTEAREEARKERKDRELREEQLKAAKAQTEAARSQQATAEPRWGPAIPYYGRSYPVNPIRPAPLAKPSVPPPTQSMRRFP